MAPPSEHRSKIAEAHQLSIVLVTVITTVLEVGREPKTRLIRVGGFRTENRESKVGSNRPACLPGLAAIGLDVLRVSHRRGGRKRQETEYREEKLCIRGHV
jgi:hypothetical protein